MTQTAVGDPLTAAREAADRHAWDEAYAILSDLDKAGLLEAAGLELLGDMAWWVHQPDISVGARERAYAAYLQRDTPRAALMALLAAQDHGMAGEDVVAGGWRARATRLLADEPESYAHGYLRMFEGLGALFTGDLDRAVDCGRQAVDIGTRHSNPDLQGFGLLCEGSALVKLGRIDEGLLLLDEATAAAVAGEFTPYATGVIYCQTISTCRDLADYRRAGQWTEVAERWCERQSISGFPGVCRVHRAEILALRGDWDAAQEQAERAANELLLFKATPQAAVGFYTLGEIRLRTGDLEGADDAFRQAQNLGFDPQPGRALLYVARGRVDAAFAGLTRVLAAAPNDRLYRAKLLPTQVEIAIAAGQIEVASVAADELAAIAEAFGSPALRGTAHRALAAVAIAEGDPDRAMREATVARGYWQELDAPYELARTRSTIANALRLTGEVEEAAMEAEAAREVFARLGAGPDAAGCTRMLDELRRGAERGERQRRTFMFTDIVGSTELLSVIGDEAWNDVKRWHDQTLRRIVAAHGGDEVNEAGDGFFFAFADVRSSVDAAIDIQQELQEHRRTAGFAPRIRIGLHAADATKMGDSYVGQGVHEAARVGALGGANEIVASTSTIAGEDVPGAGAPRMATLKGIAEPVEVQTIEWTTAPR